MKITIFISGVTGGGAEKVTCSIASYLVGKGHDIELLTMSDELPTYPLDCKVSRCCLLKESERKNFFVNNILRLLRFVKYLVIRRPDVYLAMLPTNIITLLSMRFLTKSRIIAAERANPNSYKEKIQKKLAKLADKADGWVFQTNEQQKWYMSHVNMKRRLVIPNAINSDVIKQHFCGEREKIIVTAGRLTNQKNHTMLINAYAKIANKHKDYNLVIYGEGPNRIKLEEQIKKLKLNGRVFLPGYSSEVITNVSKSSLFVLSSDFEGMPNALMEAMAIGVPCISTDCPCGGPRDLLRGNAKWGLVPINDPICMANKIEEYLNGKITQDTITKELAEGFKPAIINSQWKNYVDELIRR